MDAVPPSRMKCLMSVLVRLGICPGWADFALGPSSCLNDSSDASDTEQEPQEDKEIECLNDPYPEEVDLRAQESRNAQPSRTYCSVLPGT